MKKDPVTVSPFEGEALKNVSDDVPASHIGKREMRKLWAPVLFMVVLLGGLSTTLYYLKMPQDTRNRAATTGPTLSIEPAQKRVKAGESFPVGISLTTGDDTVSAIELHLTYDPTAVEFVSFKNGDKLSVVLEAESHGNGEIKVTLGTQPTAPFKGATIVGTLTLKQLSTKASSIAFAPATKVASIGKSENSLSGSTKGDITIGDTSSTQPSPTTTITQNSQLPPTPTVTRQPQQNNRLLPTPTVSVQQQYQQQPKQNSFGALTTTSQPTVTTTNYIPQQQTVSQPTSVPQAYTPIPSPSPVVKPTNIIENIFITIGAFLQTLFSSQNKHN